MELLTDRTQKSSSFFEVKAVEELPTGRERYLSADLT